MIEIGVQCELGVECLKYAVAADSQTTEISSSSLTRKKYCKRLLFRLNRNDDLLSKASKRFHKYKKLRRRFRSVNNLLQAAQVQTRILSKRLSTLKKTRCLVTKRVSVTVVRGQNSNNRKSDAVNLQCNDNQLRISSPIDLIDSSDDNSITGLDASCPIFGIEEIEPIANEYLNRMETLAAEAEGAAELNIGADVTEGGLDEIDAQPLDTANVELNSNDADAAESDDDEIDLAEYSYAEIKKEAELIIEDTEQITDDVFVCTICNESFDSINNLDAHMKCHSDNAVTDSNPSLEIIDCESGEMMEDASANQPTDEEPMDHIDLTLDEDNAVDFNPFDGGRRSRSRTRPSANRNDSTSRSHHGGCDNDPPGMSSDRNSDVAGTKSLSRDRNLGEQPPRRRTPSPGSSRERCIVFIGDLDNSVSREDISRMFEKYGPIKNVSLHYKRDNPNRSYAFVTFVNPRDAHRAYDERHVDPILSKMIISFGGRRSFCTGLYRDLDDTESYTPFTNTSQSRPRAVDDSFENMLRSMKDTLNRRKEPNNY